MENLQVLYVGQTLPDGLRRALTEVGAELLTVPTAHRARQTLAERPCEIVLIDAPLPDDLGLTLATDLAETPETLVLLLVPAERYELTLGRTLEQGILTLPKPCGPGQQRQALYLLLSARQRLLALRRRTTTLEEKMADIRFVARAKLLLMEREGMTEQQAHRHIEQLAMDLGLRRRAIAIKIIHRYD